MESSSVQEIFVPGVHYASGRRSSRLDGLVSVGIIRVLRTQDRPVDGPYPDVCPWMVLLNRRCLEATGPRKRCTILRVRLESDKGV